MTQRNPGKLKHENFSSAIVLQVNPEENFFL